MNNMHICQGCNLHRLKTNTRLKYVFGTILFTLTLHGIAQRHKTQVSVFVPSSLQKCSVAAKSLTTNVRCTKSATVPLSFTVCVDKFAQDIGSQKVLDTGVWEPEVQEWLMQTLEDFSAADFVDIGAVIGFHSLFAATLRRRVVRIEESFRNTESMVESVRRNNFSSSLITTLPFCTATDRLLFNHSACACIQSINDLSDLMLSPVVIMRLSPFTEYFTQVINSAEADNDGVNFFENTHIPRILTLWNITSSRSINKVKVEQVLEFFLRRGYRPSDVRNSFEFLRIEKWRQWPNLVVWSQLKPWQRILSWLNLF